MKSVDLKKLHRQALKAMKNAYAPYSKFHVGAALATTNGKIFAGCNVENASYGGTICAERSAVVAAVAELGKMQIRDLLVVTRSKTGWPPCGFCRQVIYEFANDQTRVHVANLKGIQASFTVAELLPAAFGPRHLKDE